MEWSFSTLYLICLLIVIYLYSSEWMEIIVIKEGTSISLLYFNFNLMEYCLQTLSVFAIWMITTFESDAISWNVSLHSAQQIMFFKLTNILEFCEKSQVRIMGPKYEKKISWPFKWNKRENKITRCNEKHIISS